jgi:hypothetical protein
MDPTEPTALETGWLPTASVGDTYLRRFLHNWAGMCAAIARALGGRSRDLPAMLLSSDDGRSIYERMGFLPLQRLTLWYRPRPG